MLMWRRLSLIWGENMFEMLIHIFSLHFAFYHFKCTDFAVLCPRKLSKKQPERACIWKKLLPRWTLSWEGKMESGEAERCKGMVVSLWAAPRSQKGWLRCTQEEPGTGGTSGPAAHACRRSRGPPDFRGTACLDNDVTGQQDTVCLKFYSLYIL